MLTLGGTGTIDPEQVFEIAKEKGYKITDLELDVP
jgi:hypothetical protein